MRKMALILSLAFVIVVASASDVFAQRGRIGVGRGYGSGYYGSGYYGSRYYGSGYYAGSQYYSPYYSGYYAAPYVNQVVPIVPIVPEIRQSYYAEPAVAQQSALVTVRVPTPDAQVWFDGSLTQQQGMQRVFNSPALTAGYAYSYMIKARWIANGQPVEREQRVQVQAGQAVTVDFR